MSVYYTNELMFDLPEGEWNDESIQVIASKDVDGGRMGVTIGREALPLDVSVRARAEAFEQRQSRQFPAYTLLGKRESTVAGSPAFEVKYSFLHEEAMLTQRQIYMSTRGLLLVMTGSIPSQHGETLDRLMDALVQSLRFRPV